jgi:hypothetical protein
VGEERSIQERLFRYAGRTYNRATEGQGGTGGQLYVGRSLHIREPSILKGEALSDPSHQQRKLMQD